MKISINFFLKGLKAIILFFFITCQDNSNALSEINQDLQEPLGTAWNIRMIYTDSTKIQAILTAPKHLDYTNLSFRSSSDFCSKSVHHN